MSSLLIHTDALAFEESVNPHVLREESFFSHSIAASKNYIFDIEANLPIRQPADERELVQPSQPSSEEEIHPADREFVVAARKVIEQKFETAVQASTSIKASMQFRVICPKGKVRLLNQVLSPFGPGATSKHQVNVVETDLTPIATNPVKSLRVFTGANDPKGNIVKLKGFESGTTDCPFSDRQLQILRFLAEGKTTAEISKALFISSDTVRTHRQHILQRSEQTNMTATVVHCVRKGWL